MKALNQLLEGRSERERIILIAGVVVAIPLMVWLLLWQPLLNARSSAESRVEQRRSAYVWMQQAAEQFQMVRGRVPQASSGAGSPQQQITGAAAALAINVNRIEPQSSGRYSLWVANTDYSSAVRLIEALSVSGMTVYSVNMSLLDVPGNVSLRASVGSEG